MATRETALVYPFGGESEGGLTKEKWRCFLSYVEEAQVHKGEWHSGASHRKAQRCVDRLYVDVNTAVPNQPGRR